MKIQILRRSLKAAVIAGLALIFLTTIVSSGLSHRVVRRHHYRYNSGYYTVSYHGRGRVVYGSTTTVVRYRPRYVYYDPYCGGYHYDPYYGSRYPGHAGVGIRVRF